MIAVKEAYDISLWTILCSLLSTLSLAIFLIVHIIRLNKRTPAPSVPSEFPKSIRSIRTIRATDVPHDNLEVFAAYLNEASSGAVRLSFGPSVSSMDQNWVATISFEAEIPEPFRNCVSSDEGTDEYVQIKHAKIALSLSLDTHFHGLTPLNYVKSPVVDLVAVTGLAAHAFGTWKAREGEDMWLRDYLPADLESLNTRIMIYGYDSKLAKSVNRASLHDYAKQFLEMLKTARQTDVEKRRPLILLGHSLGGLVIKHALKEAAQGDNEDQMTLKACYALLFFGTPTRGMNIETLRSMVKRQPNAQLVNDLGPESQVLPALEREFHRQFNFPDSKILSFYETKDTPTVQFIDGRWQRKGPPVPMVPRNSALNNAPGEQFHDQIPLDGDHTSMVKFSRRGSQGYQTVRQRIRKLVEDAPAVIKSRFTEKTASVTKDLSTQGGFSLPLDLNQCRNPNFTGRGRALYQLHQELSRKKGTRTVVVRGTGGVGKSELVREYIYQHEEAYAPVFWINTSSLETTRSSFVKIGRRLSEFYTSKDTSIAHEFGLADSIDQNGSIVTDDDITERIVQAVRKWFTKPGNDRWLLVFDNVDDPSFSFLEFFPPAQPGYIILTSRGKECAQSIPNCTELVLDAMDEKESVSLLGKGLQRDIKAASQDYLEAIKLVDGLENLPLAIVQAAAYLHRLSKPLNSYIPLFDNSVNFVQAMKPPTTGTEFQNEIVFATGNENLLSRGMKSMKDIPVMDDYDFFVADAVTTLVEFGLATRQGDTGSFSIHPLTVFWARERLDQEEKWAMSHQALQLVASTINIGCNGTNPRVPGDRNFEISIEPHLTSCTMWVEKLHYKDGPLGEYIERGASQTIATLYYQHEKLTQALEWHGHVLAAYEKAFGPESPAALATINNMAIIFRDQGEHTLALECYERVLEEGEKTLGREHALTMSAANNMALVFDTQGRYDEAVECYERVLVAKEKALGAEHPSTLSTVNNLAMILDSQGKYEEALVLFQRALTGNEKLFGRDHGSSMDIVNNMGMVFYKQKKYNEALEWYSRALAGKEKALGKDHPSTLNTANNMASVFSIQGNFDQALEWYGRVLSRRERVLGKEHPLTLGTVNNMAIAFEGQGKSDQALHWYRRTLAGKEKTLGKEHPSTLSTVNNIACVLSNQGKYKQALDWYDRALAGSRKMLGNDHPTTLGIAQNLENLHQKCSGVNQGS